MSRAESEGQQLALLELIKERKNLLFGSFHEPKINAWKEILQKAESLGLATAGRNWTYARDNIFGLWQSRTLSKLYNAETKGGEDIKLDSIDKVILDILEIDSPVAKGLGLPKVDDIPGVSILTEESCNHKTSKISSAGNNHLISGQNKRKFNPDSVELLKEQVLESELHKNKLKILKLERELGISPSKFTMEIKINNNNKE